MKELNSDTTQQHVVGQVKLFYSKPIATQINLFADRVLDTGCLVSLGSVCSSTNPCSNNGSLA